MLKSARTKPSLPAPRRVFILTKQTATKVMCMKIWDVDTHAWIVASERNDPFLHLQLTRLESSCIFTIASNWVSTIWTAICACSSSFVLLLILGVMKICTCDMTSWDDELFAMLHFPSVHCKCEPVSVQRASPCQRLHVYRAYPRKAVGVFLLVVDCWLWRAEFPVTDKNGSGNNKLVWHDTLRRWRLFPR